MLSELEERIAEPVSDKDLDVSLAYIGFPSINKCIIKASV